MNPSEQPSAPASTSARLQGLIVDYAGVLTTPVVETMAAWASEYGIDGQRLRAVLAEWLGSAYGAGVETSPVHALERGEITVAEFERELAGRLCTRTGGAVAAEGLLQRMFAGFEAVPAMHALVRRARATGLRTCLLSNSWGDSYSRAGWEELFDAVVISGEVGMRKPEERIYRHAADAIGLAPASCAFVDDIDANVRAARALGMVAVRHQTPEQTAQSLEAALGTALR